MPDPVLIRPAASVADFAAAAGLLRRMQDWDLQMTTRLTGTTPDLAALYQDADPSGLQQAFTAPRSALLLAQAQGQVQGCAGFSPLQPGQAELRKVWVNPEARGLGLGGALLDAALSAMAAAGHTVALLETAGFMQSAITLYRSRGFTPCPPFRPPFDAQSLFFARALGTAETA